MTPQKAKKPTREDDLDQMLRRFDDMQPGIPPETVPDAEPPVTPVKKKKKNNPQADAAPQEVPDLGQMIPNIY
jgi:hypothetical protein